MIIDLQEQIRQKILKRRLALSSQQVRDQSHRIIQRLLSSPWMNQKTISGLHIGFYSSMSSEVELSELRDRVRTWGGICYFPRVIDTRSRKMEFARVDHEHDERNWRWGPYGIREPSREIPAVERGLLDMIIVPAVALGEKGERIGMGGGYYDRFLAQVQQALRISLVYDFQVLPELPHCDLDQPVHWIVTESQELKTPFFEEWWSRRERL